MKTQQQLAIKYHKNFADNFSSLAYAKILEKNNIKFFYENHTNNKQDLEALASYFDLDINFMSLKRIDSITQKSYFLSRILLNKKDIFKKCIKQNTLSKEVFDIDDIELLDSNIKNMFRLKNTDFIVDFDIFDEITSSNSIGIYISKDDKLSDDDIDFVQKSISRLNKFIKKPKLFIFTNKKDFHIDTFVDYRVLDIADFREEYYFLSKCRHHIILDTKNSYSMNLWSALVYGDSDSYTTIRNSKNIKKRNFIVIS